MGNAAMNTRALNRLSESGLRYRFSRCCICMVSIERLDWIEESSDDDETNEILKCRNVECSRIFHRNCLEKYFESVGSKICPGCGEKIKGRIVMVTPRDREETPSR